MQKSMDEKSIPPRKNELTDTGMKPTVKLPWKTLPVKIRSDKPEHLSSTYPYNSDLPYDKTGAGISTTDSRVGEPKRMSRSHPYHYHKIRWTPQTIGIDYSSITLTRLRVILYNLNDPTFHLKIPLILFQTLPT